MTTDQKAEYTTREAILKLLSDDEVASVSTAETAASLAHGEEYLDLEHLDQGVQSADGDTASLGNVLTRKAVHADTWDKIVKQLSAS
ncbi:MAG TPA: hypothetical protein VGS22_24755 [Thermoanaerobaculia bacterium]|nr:hypothetical protein [Thermoanaerobaculia bacterium]